MHLLFLTRLLVYALAVALPLVHPAVVVPYDRTGYLVWFALVPLEMLLAYSLRHAATGTTAILRRGRGARLAARAQRWLRPTHLLAAAGLAVVAVIAFGTGFDSAAWLVAGAGAGAFLLTLLIFGSREYGHTIAAAELFFIGYIYVKMLRFSRASEAISGASSLLTTVLLLVSIGGFLLHGIVIYQAAFPNRRPGPGRIEERKRGRRELTLFASVIIPLIIVLAVILPPDFVEHQISFNELNELPPSPPVPVDDFSDAPPGGNLRGEQQFDPRDSQGGGQGDQQQNQQDGEQGEGETGQMPGLVGIPAREWEQRNQPRQPQQPQPQPAPGDDSDNSGGTGGSEGEQGQAGGGAGQTNNPNQGETGEEGDGNQDSGDGEGENQQHAVMIIVSQHDPVYAADGYFGLFDGTYGFSYSRDEPLNELVYRRLFETWEDPEPPRELGRTAITHGFFSTIPERVTAYRPLAVEPTVQQRRYHPFDLSYRVVSQVSTAGPDGWRQARSLSGVERDRMSGFLEVPLDTEQRARFQAYLDQAVAGGESDFDRIDQLLRSYADYQYEIGFTDDVSIAHVDDFLFETRAGDCTEFSNTSAILGRMLGIPTRVVTGWLGSESLQTPQHARGAAILRQSIEPLQEYPVEDLYLITTAHRHSWTQFWLPDFGWIDFETTVHAKAPPPGADANSLDIVIPIIEVEEVPVPRDFLFPWRFALTVLGTLTAAGIMGAYGLRYGREGWLTLRARHADAGGLLALGKLLCMRMANAGCALKPHAHTVQEYARQYPEIGRFAALYSMLRYRTAFDPGERTSTWQELRAQYQTALKGVRKGGLLDFLRRTFSLRALFY